MPSLPTWAVNFLRKAFTGADQTTGRHFRVPSFRVLYKIVVAVVAAAIPFVQPRSDDIHCRNLSLISVTRVSQIAHSAFPSTSLEILLYQ
eukprot:COSAG02_NODE_42460_length_384_cov_0.957895_1_plen_89_part_10